MWEDFKKFSNLSTNHNTALQCCFMVEKISGTFVWISIPPALQQTGVLKCKKELLGFKNACPSKIVLKRSKRRKSLEKKSQKLDELLSEGVFYIFELLRFHEIFINFFQESGSLVGKVRKFILGGWKVWRTVFVSYFLS